MPSRLPELVDPWRLADSGAGFSGLLPLSRLGRLADILADVAGEVAFEIVFERDDRRRACILGRLSSRLTLICQRCLEPMTVDIDQPLRLALVESVTEAELLPDDYDPVLVEDGLLSPADLIEDELLLGLPQAPMHAIAECTAAWTGQENNSEHLADKARENPFSVLTKLKQNLD